MTLPSSSVARRTVRALRPRPALIHEREFWRTQALIAGATAAVYLGHAYATAHDLHGGVHDILTMLYIIPVLYAAIAYGVAGAVLTTLCAAVLVLPHSAMLVREDLQWLADAGMLATILVAGIFLAVRVESERDARQRAEATSRRLTLLNDVGAVLARSRQLPGLLRELVDTVRAGLALDFVCVYYTTEPAGAEPLFVVSGNGAFAGSPARLRALAAGAADGAGQRASPALPPAGWVVVPLVAEQRSFGVLAGAREGHSLTTEERQVLAIVGREASVALDNLWLERDRRESLTHYARRVTDALEDERRRIARELHDGVTQTLSGLVRGLELVWHDVDTSAAATSVEGMRTAAQEALSDIRRVSRDLRPATLDDLGLLPAVESLVAELGERSGVEAGLRSTGAWRTLTDAHQLCIFRIVQEALSNVERHAHASAVEVTVDFQPGEVLVIVRDDGVGIGKPSAVADFARQGRFGLLGMQERAALHGGTLTVTPVAGGGTSVTLRLPTDDAARSDAEGSSLARE